jgi:hypothetical protein
VEVTTGGSGELEFSILGTGGKVGGEAKRAASHNLTFRFRPFRDGFEDPATKDDGPVPGLDPTLFPGIDVGQIMKKSPRGLPKTYLTGKKKPPV